jgi:hypothetical protein
MGKIRRGAVPAERSMNVFDDLFQEESEKPKPVSEFKSAVKLRQLERISKLLAQGEALVAAGKVSSWYSHHGPWILDPQFLVPGRTAEYAGKKVFWVPDKSGIFCGIDEQRRAAFDAINAWRTNGLNSSNHGDGTGKLVKGGVLVTTNGEEKLFTFEELGGKPKKCTKMQLAVLAEEKRLRDLESQRISRLVTKNKPKDHIVSGWSVSGSRITGYYIPKGTHDYSKQVIIKLSD